MATDGDKIKGYIIAELQDNPNVNVDFPFFLELIDAIAKGVYKGMQELDDKTGTPPSTGHQ